MKCIFFFVYLLIAHRTTTKKASSNKLISNLAQIISFYTSDLYFSIYFLLFLIDIVFCLKEFRKKYLFLMNSYFTCKVKTLSKKTFLFINYFL